MVEVPAGEFIMGTTAEQAALRQWKWDTGHTRGPLMDFDPETPQLVVRACFAFASSLGNRFTPPEAAKSDSKFPYAQIQGVCAEQPIDAPPGRMRILRAPAAAGEPAPVVAIP